MYELQILGLKKEESPFLVHKLSVIYTALQYKSGLKNIQIAGYNGTLGKKKVLMFGILILANNRPLMLWSLVRVRTFCLHQF